MKSLERIQKLLALSQSSNEHEARNAAMQCCKLLTQHKVLLSLPNEAPPAAAYRNVRTGERPTQSVEDVMRNGAPIPTRQPFDTFVDALFGQEAVRRARQAWETSPAAETMNAPVDGVCKDCGKEFRMGDRIWHRRGVGSVHTMTCDPDLLNRKGGR